jgi:Ca-activated chloride channel homolog
MDSWYHLYWLSLNKLQSFTWHSPQYLFGPLLIPLAYLFRWLFQSRDKDMLILPLDTHLISQTSKIIGLLRFLPSIFFTLATTLVFISLARPQLEQKNPDTSQLGIDVVLAIDISESMNAQDIQPTRLAAAKAMAKAFTERRKYDRIGLVGFGSKAMMLCPLTTDHDILLQQLSEANSSYFSENGTALGDALAQALAKLKTSASAAKVVILMSDGAETTGILDTRVVAELCKDYGVRIYAIAIGSDLAESTDYAEKVDQSTLQTIASLSRGYFFRATNPSTLTDVFKKINTIEASKYTDTSQKIMNDYYSIYLYWGLAFMFLSLLLRSTFMSNIMQD